MSDRIEMKYVKLNDSAPGTQWKGYFGGTYINKWGKPNITLYNKVVGGGISCTVIGLSADLKKKITQGTAHLELEYRGMVFTGKYHCHSFTVKCLPMPMNNPAAEEFMAVIKAHTQSLTVPNAMAPSGPINDPFSQLARESVPPAQVKDADPFTALDVL